MDLHEKLFNELDDANFDNLLSENPLPDEWWKEKLNSELGGIPGLQL